MDAFVIQSSRGVIIPAIWDDPSITGHRGTSAHLVVGWRRSDVIMSLHRRSPLLITEQHVRSVERLRDDHEIGVGVRGVGRGSGGGIGPTEAQLDAIGRERAAIAAVGPSLCGVLLPVALDGLTVAQVSSRVGVSEHRGGGLLIAAIWRLRDFYDPPSRR